MASTSGDPSAAEALRRGRILSSRLYLDGVPSSKVRHPNPSLSSHFAAVGRDNRMPFAQAPVVYSPRTTSSSTGSRSSE